MLLQKSLKPNGFTLIEILVSTAIFVTVVSAMMAMFTYTLKINRRVQSLREIVQSSRLFTETLTREIRNGHIDYSSWTAECNASNYTSTTNQSLSVLTKDGDKACFYISADNQLYIKKQTISGTTTAKMFENNRFHVIPGTFRFRVFPQTNPNPATPPYPEQQPFVTILGQFELTGVDTTPQVMNYQTTISTDVYDVYNEN